MEGAMTKREWGSTEDLAYILTAGTVVLLNKVYLPALGEKAAQEGKRCPHYGPEEKGSRVAGYLPRPGEQCRRDNHNRCQDSSPCQQRRRCPFCGVGLCLDVDLDEAANLREEFLDGGRQENVPQPGIVRRALRLPRKIGARLLFRRIGHESKSMRSDSNMSNLGGER